MSSSARDHLTGLPEETVLNIMKFGLSNGDLAALAATSSRFNDVASEVLYRKNVQQEDGIAGKWDTQ